MLGMCVHGSLGLRQKLEPVDLAVFGAEVNPTRRAKTNSTHAHARLAVVLLFATVAVFLSTVE